MIGVGFAVAQGLGLAGQFASGILSAQSRQAEFDEQLRRLRLKRDQTVGMAQARAAASGLMPGSVSTDKYLSALAGTFNAEINSVSGAKDATGMADLLGNLSSLIGGGANLAGGLGKLNNWSF